MNPDQLTMPEGKELSIPVTSTPENNTNTWIFETIRPYAKGRILEIGSGISTITSLFIEKGIPLHLSETDKDKRRELREKYKDNKIIRGIHSVDFNRINFDKQYSYMSGVFSCVFKIATGINETADSSFTTNSQLLLQEGGYLIMVAPVHTAVYNESMDDG